MPALAVPIEEEEAVQAPARPTRAPPMTAIRLPAHEGRATGLTWNSKAPTRPSSARPLTTVGSLAIVAPCLIEI